MTNLKILIIILVFASCNSSLDQKKEAVTYDKNSLSFSIPKHWKIEKDKDIEGIANSRFITLNNDTKPADQEFIVITAIDSGISLNRYVEILIRQAEAGYVKRNIAFTQLTDPTAVKIGLKKALRVEFKTKVSENISKGSFTTFFNGKKTFAFVTSADAKDENAHRAAVDSVITSLKMK